jgi:hypothetical protein
MTSGIASGGFAICQDDPGSGVISGFSGGIDPGQSGSQPVDIPIVTAPGELRPDRRRVFSGSSRSPPESIRSVSTIVRALQVFFYSRGQIRLFFS